MLRKNVKVHKQKRKKDFSLYRLIACCLILTILFCFKVNAQEITLSNEYIKSIEQLEEKIFYQKFDNNTIEDRLSRIEKLIFGKISKENDPVVRINNLTEALNKPEETLEPLKPKPLPKITPETIPKEENTKEPKVIYGDSFNTGILGKIKDLEIKLYGTSFEDKPFQKRIEDLEDKLLSATEKYKNRSKPLLERVSYLLDKFSQNKQNETLDRQSQDYTIDPNTGLLINENTGEIVKDRYGNPIMIKHPEANLFPNQNLGIPDYENPFVPSLPYGNNSFTNPINPGQLPLDLFLRQNQINTDDDFEY